MDRLSDGIRRRCRVDFFFHSNKTFISCSEVLMVQMVEIKGKYGWVSDTGRASSRE